MTDTTKQIASFDPGRVLQDQVAAWTKERDRLQELIDTASLAATPSQVPAEKQRPLIAWLEEARRCGLPTVEAAARTMMDYYQGATSDDPAEPATAELPPLPKRFDRIDVGTLNQKNEFDVFTADQMRDYARAAIASRPAPVAVQGEVVVTWDEARTRIVAVTRQDEEGRVLSVIAHAPVAAMTVEQVRDAARDAALAECEAICDSIYRKHRDQYKGRGDYAPDNPRRADPHCDGCADGAAECEEAICKLRTTASGEEGADRG